MAPVSQQPPASSPAAEGLKSKPCSVWWNKKQDGYDWRKPSAETLTVIDAWERAFLMKGTRWPRDRERVSWGDAVHALYLRETQAELDASNIKIGLTPWETLSHLFWHLFRPSRFSDSVAMGWVDYFGQWVGSLATKSTHWPLSRKCNWAWTHSMASISSLLHC